MSYLMSASGAIPEQLNVTLYKNVPKTCTHWVLRKKRYCKMTVAKGRDYCGEHEPAVTCDDSKTDINDDRIPCPLDPKHTIFRQKLHKHLKICNARSRENTLPYIEKNINIGEAGVDIEMECEYSCLKLHELREDEFYGIVEKVKLLYKKYIENKIETLHVQHKILDVELAKQDYGNETRKHLFQASALLGILQHEEQLNADTSYVEFGAGKGQLAYYMAKLLEADKLMRSQVVLLDRMSVRHKKDNKVEDRTLVQRIRVDIADFKMEYLDVLKQTKRNVAFSKHLCGAATDLTLRCVTNQRRNIEKEPSAACKTEFVMIAVCCHHRCEWRSYVGKNFLQREKITPREFVIIKKMVSWAICGTGLSRERRNALEKQLVAVEEASTDHLTASGLQQQRLTRAERENVGFMCKRVLDQGRIEFLQEHGYKACLKYYVPRNVTLENVCILAKRSSDLC